LLFSSTDSSAQAVSWDESMLAVAESRLMMESL
jgi:hypothetical protein